MVMNPTLSSLTLRLCSFNSSPVFLFLLFIHRLSAWTVIQSSAWLNPTFEGLRVGHTSSGVGVI